ncbi:response regulator transcription factor [Candidatus Sulfidibacterium hydrothermale]|uniref:response regulator transcription factor n=1 Tax=Candidatus Sulfidibacterium hydrothermale TaxID=2875962 RepID=UPI001F0A1552|nr:response regulator transcription factor [Candidatus Sulfidibacterium hydrothermale]UBM62182.1 response regulator transcription factor [Candidatus Sulfidibacterium hydrothermale]
MKKKVNILLAEDDKNLGTILKSYLQAKGFEATLCENGKLALEAFKKGEFDFAILDVMMPVMDGFTLAKEIRKIDKKIPLLFLTAKTMEEDKIQGFELGADDYLTKPFSMEELLLRIQAILRRTEQGSKKHTNSIYKFGRYTFDYDHQVLKIGKTENKLTSKETELLRLLCENLNEVLDRTVALNKIWQDDSYFNARSMDVYITKLRKFLKEDPKVELINVHGIGFKLVAPEK